MVGGTGPFTVHTERYHVPVGSAIEVHAFTEVDGAAMPVVSTTRFGAGLRHHRRRRANRSRGTQRDEFITRGLA
jgi:hypothetical protein